MVKIYKALATPVTAPYFATLGLFRENKIQNISGVEPQQASTVQNGFKHKLHLEDEEWSKRYLTLDGRDDDFPIPA